MPLPPTSLGDPGDERTSSRQEHTVFASEVPTTVDLPDARAQHALLPGSRLDRFVLRELLGEGGMGRVHRAYDPKLDRDVALKVLRHSPTARGEAGLLREAQAMARLSHPNLLPVFDIGRHGRSLFIAMELVQGQTLGRWLQRSPRALDELMPVMLAAGRGLEAAHGAGLVHRDFKPSNVMIGDDGRVRVMDLGLARLAEDDSAPPSETLLLRPSLEAPLTETGMVAGTPLYMAPEQHQGPADARADQYSFCVVLWEAVFGQRPFLAPDCEQLLRVKLAGPPAAPDAPKVPRWLLAALRRGLAPSPEDRFASMAELSSTLEAGLGGQRRGLRRAGAGVLATAGVASIVLLGSPGEAPCQGARGRLEGVWDEPSRERVHTALLETEVAHAAETWERLAPALDEYSSSWVSTHDDACAATRVRHEQPEWVMDARMRCLDEHRRRLAALVDTLRTADARVVDNAVRSAGALPSLERCVDPELARREAPVPDDLELRARVESLRDELARGTALREAGRPDQALAIAQRVHSEVGAMGYGPLAAEADLFLGSAQEDTGHYPEAVDALRRAYFGAEDRPRIQAQSATELVFVLGRQQQEHDEATQWAKHAQAAVERVDDDELRATLLDTLAGLEHAQVHLDEARELLQRALEIRGGTEGASPLDQANTHNNLGIIHYSEGRFDEALASFVRATEIQTRALGPRHPQTAHSLGNVGAAHEAVGRYDEALEHYRRALAIQQELLGPDHPNVAMLINNIGIVLASRGELEPALEHYHRALGIREAVLGPHHPDTAVSVDSIAGVLEEQGRLERALEHRRRALEIRTEVLGPDHPATALSLNNLGFTLHRLGRDDEALPLLERALRLREDALGPDHPRVANSLHYLGQVLRARGEHDEALRVLRRALAIWEPALEPTHPDLLMVLENLGALLVDMDRAEEAIEPLERVLAVREDRGGASRAAPRFALARALVQAGRERERASALARGARADLAAAEGDHEDALAELDQWLSTHGR